MATGCGVAAPAKFRSRLTIAAAEYGSRVGASATLWLARDDSVRTLLVISPRAFRVRSPSAFLPIHVFKQLLRDIVAESF